MNGPVYARTEFLSELKITDEVLSRWEKMGLVRPSGTLDGGDAFFSEVNVEEARQILKLVDLGYDLEGIQKIVRKVGLPQKKEKGAKARDAILLTVGQLAEVTGLNARTIKYWEERGILQPDGRSVGGYRLYSKQTAELCTLIRDLQVFGYPLEEIKDAADLIRDFNSIRTQTSLLTAHLRRKKLAEMDLKLGKLEERINSLRDGMKRWDTILKKQRREIQQHLAKVKVELKPKEKRDNGNAKKEAKKK